MIVDKIYKWLNDSEREPDYDALARAEMVFREKMIRFMTTSDRAPGRLYVTGFTHPCARQGAYKFFGFDSEPLAPRVRINFMYGDITELLVVEAAKLAGCNIWGSQDPVFVEVASDTEIMGHPDGLFEDANGQQYILEVKKQSEWGFKKPIDNAFGYLAQAHAYMAGSGLRKTIFVRLNGQTGALAEQVVDFDEETWEAARQRAVAILKSAGTKELPPRAFELEKEDKKGRRKLVLQCRYCGFRDTCWPDLEMTYSDKAKTKPVWFLK